MIHAMPQIFSDTQLNQLNIVQTHDGCYTLQLGTHPIVTNEGRPLRHQSYHLIDAIRREAWLQGQLDVTQSGVYGLFCTQYDVIISGNDGIPNHITDILHHHEALFWRNPGPEGNYQLHAWESVIKWLDTAHLRLPLQASQRETTLDQFVVESYAALSSAQRAVVSYLFHQHTTSILLPMMVAMGHATASMYAAGMCMTTLLPPATGHTWSEYRQYHQHFAIGAQSAQEYLWLVAR